MQTILPPKNPKYVEIDKNSGKFIIEGCYPGYGTTLGNALRRILLSSLEGAAATAFKMKGVSHEFSTTDGIMEDAVQIMLNLKKVRFKMEGDETARVTLKSKGEGEVLAKEIKCPTGIEVVNGDQPIATITDKNAEVDMEIEVSKGLGYVPVEQQEREEKEIGVIAIDAVYTPIKRVNYEVQNMRVGKRTDYNRITLEVITDGSVEPKDAFQKSVQILVDQFSALFELTSGDVEEKTEKGAEKETKEEVVEEKKEEGIDPKDMKVSDLKNVSTRTLNVLEDNKVVTVGDIANMTEEDLKELEGMGDKGVKEIRKAVGTFGLTLKQPE